MSVWEPLAIVDAPQATADAPARHLPTQVPSVAGHIQRAKRPATAPMNLQ